MECSGMNMTITTPSSTLHQLSHSSSSSSSPPSSPAPTPTPPSVIVSPCAACKILRRRCVERCVLAPYFPPTEPAKFTIAHRVFGASNIIKFLQELPESQRADAVSSMVYEASARIRDPIYGCAGAISQLQKQVSELQAQLAKAQAEVVNMKCQQANLLALICMQDVSQTPQASPPHDDHHYQYYSHENLITTTTTCPDQSYQQSNSLSFLDDYNNLSSLMWPEPLWT